MHAYHDPNAQRVDSMCVQTSSCIREYMPQLAERAGLGSPLPRDYSWKHYYENGEIHVKRVNEQECS